ncbi:hypothetical protein K438DRAFT_1765252 [Mycena galopus ATCC 62051]|nr:hypothetical protein K438DRAFT_1765252 [Mycena galopus ATCC 62051]
MPASWVKSSGEQGKTAGVGIGILPGREGVTRGTRKKDRKKSSEAPALLFGRGESNLELPETAHEYVEKEPKRKTTGGLCQKRWDILLARQKSEERRNEANKKEKAEKKRQW